MQGGALDRREVVALAVAAAGALSGCIPPQSRPEPLPVTLDRFVDIHCHIFNAADVPAAGFVVHVAAREYEFEDYKYLIAFFVALLAGGAPAPQSESEKLRQRNAGESPLQPALGD